LIPDWQPEWLTHRAVVIATGCVLLDFPLIIASWVTLGGAMWLLDLVTLLLILAAGLDLGVLGLFGYDAAAALFGGYTRIAYSIVGCGAVWQLFRQQI